jgi:23S rRNA (cytidine2498-2'-O)-methyltransferase
MTLLSKRLPPIKERMWPFPCELPDAELGGYTLLDRNTLLYSPTCRSPFPHGEVRFVETPSPPSRAYRKLWEVFTLCQIMPQRGERCIDMGATPGGWTWVLAELGANVRSIDKAPLHPDVAGLPNVKVKRESAFGVDPRLVENPYDWFFSDVICYPERLLAMVQRWLDAGAARRFVCTIKFKGETDHKTVDAFAKIPGSRLLHLHHNRHELTWIKLD